ncbi:DUF5955 family protein [Streptomyces sp. NPDC088725]|uniref:DUF5955 family protein n=1 Tax=Streptomyces sp. NPDC088725 TaxID=3365873 RepID=UPI003809D09C
MLHSVWQTRVTEKSRELSQELSVLELRAAVTRLRRELAGHAAEFKDRAIAEDELSALAGMAADGDPEVARMRRSLLLIVGSIGSVSVLRPALMGVRDAVELFSDALPRRLG